MRTQELETKLERIPHEGRAHGAPRAAEGTAGRKAFGQLVALGFDVAVFTPAPYQRRRLRRPSKELSSRGGLRA